MLKTIDLYTALLDQIEFIPINKNEYFINNRLEIFSKRINRKPKLSNNDTTIDLYIPGYGTKRFAINRIYAFIQSGLPEGMLNIKDKNYKPYFKDNKWCFLSNKVFQMQSSLNKLSIIKKEHPELSIKDGFCDEGIILYKNKPGYYFVPTTNGTIVYNPILKKVFTTYTDTEIKIRRNRRGDEIVTLNKRLCGRTNIYLSRIQAFLFLSVPEKYRNKKAIRDIVSNLEVDHIDGNPFNGNINNLQYLTPKENIIKKLEQEKDPRVFPTTWKTPDGNIVRFRSLRTAADSIKTTNRVISNIYKGWRKNTYNINGWTLLSNNFEHRDEKWYIFFESKGIDRNDLTKYRRGLAAINTITKLVTLYNNIKTFAIYNSINESRLDSHINNKGPLSPINNHILIPIAYLNILLESKILEEY